MRRAPITGEPAAIAFNFDEKEQWAIVMQNMLRREGIAFEISTSQRQPVQWGNQKCHSLWLRHTGRPNAGGVWRVPQASDHNGGAFRRPVIRERRKPAHESGEYQHVFFLRYD